MLALLKLLHQSPQLIENHRLWHRVVIAQHVEIIADDLHGRVEQDNESPVSLDAKGFKD